jgi:predicted lipid-binding transport protein (Tim44 family)
MMTDEYGLQNLADAALGHLQNLNINNPEISGTPANQRAQTQQSQQLGSKAGSDLGTLLAGLGGGALLFG